MEITTRVGCKNNCSYCPQSILIERYKKRTDIFDMSFDLFKTCLDKMPRDVLIDFSGMAEPWLNKRCTDMLLYADRQGFSLTVYTTLVGMDIDDIRLIEGVKYRKFEVHLPDAEGLTSIPYNEKHLAKITKIASSEIANINFMTIGKLHPVVDKVISQKVNEHAVVDRAGNVSGCHDVRTRKRLTGLISCKSCGEDLNHNILLPDGTVILCCMDYGMRHVLGNLNDINYDELYSGSSFRNLRRRLVDDSQDILCRYCQNAARSRLNWLPGMGYYARKKVKV